MLALQQAHAANGTDPALEQIATTAIPVVMQHSSALIGPAGGAMQGCANHAGLCVGMA
ncbi:hypothetical protein [Sphingomonas nostoxanthinifaciens]|uniref:hypothetical protein n=1 Tax=Sphingomonas nostoxanthinifaciens TaxID=2872652 RepID=UPI001CC1E099|nr:hypothetical protein [Sphingomonas nostoxanthinifaciens]UAK23109.1 hypothetical protein K8P63_11835 [Sphingomonas nostoxanthinifaciens]